MQRGADVGHQRGDAPQRIGDRRHQRLDRVGQRADRQIGDHAPDRVERRADRHQARRDQPGQVGQRRGQRLEAAFERRGQRGRVPTRKLAGHGGELRFGGAEQRVERLRRQRREVERGERRQPAETGAQLAFERLQVDLAQQRGGARHLGLHLVDAEVRERRFALPHAGRERLAQFAEPVGADRERVEQRLQRGVVGRVGGGDARGQRRLEQRHQRIELARERPRVEPLRHQPGEALRFAEHGFQHHQAADRAHQRIERRQQPRELAHRRRRRETAGAEQRLQQRRQRAALGRAGQQRRQPQQHAEEAAFAAAAQLGVEPRDQRVELGAQVARGELLDQRQRRAEAAERVAGRHDRAERAAALRDQRGDRRRQPVRVEPAGRAADRADAVGGVGHPDRAERRGAAAERGAEGVDERARVEPGGQVERERGGHVGSPLTLSSQLLHRARDHGSGFAAPLAGGLAGRAGPCGPAPRQAPKVPRTFGVRARPPGG